jgi:hypothetical protein
MTRNCIPLLFVAALLASGSVACGQNNSRGSGVELPDGVKTGVNTFVDKKRGTSISVVIPEATQVYRGRLNPYYGQRYPRYNAYRQPYYYGYPAYPSTYPYPYTYTAPGVYYPYYPRRGYYYGVTPGTPTFRVAPRNNSGNPLSGTSHYFGNPHASQYLGR